MWIRVWFADGDKRHQRGYTLVDPDPAADTVDIDFALHDGVASRWAQEAQPGDTIEATVLGSNLTLPSRGRPATSSAATPDITWVDRKNAGEAPVEAVSSSAFDASDHFGWVACDNRTTRAVARIFREDYKISRKSVKAQAYWVA